CIFRFPAKHSLKRSDELEITEGTILGDHHVVEAFLGEGSFGVVTRCRDTKNNQTVAIKVNKSDPEILQQAKQEIFILEQLQRLDPDRCNIVEWNGYFLDGERICLNFELLDQSLSDYIGDRNNQGLPIRELRPILHQLANALFHLGSVGIVHADLKPVNIMVVNRHESPVKVKLIDFGIACNTSAVIAGGAVGTIGYCAPEIMLGTPYDEAIDMWSLGLFIIETQDDLEQLLEVRRGPENGQPLFVRLIKQMLALDANQRITPSEVLKHPFFDTGLSKSAPCLDINSTGGKNLVLSQQPSSWNSHGSQKFNCSFQNSVEFPQKGQVNTSANPSSSEDDLQITEGTILGDHHVVEAFLGEGGFGLMLALDANQRITPSEVLKHPFFDTGLSGKAPCTDMNSTGGENLVLSQQPSSWKSHGSQKFNCSFQNSVEFPQKGQVNTSANPSSSEDDLEITEGTIL
uniref:Protein kinase domain-containing protein n=2 Tax=Oreochromis TaxID=8139 RepID=A0A669BH24_ORENI